MQQDKITRFNQSKERREVWKQMITALQARPLLSVSFGLYWLWMFMLLQNPDSRLEATPLPTDFLPLGFFVLLANIIMYFTVGLGYRRLNFIGRFAAYPYALATSMTLGVLFYIIEAGSSPDQTLFRIALYLGASVLVGFGTACFCLRVGRAFGLLGPQQVLFHGTFALFWGTVGALIINLLPSYIQSIILLVVPSIMVICLYRSIATISTNKLYTQGLDAKARVPWKFLAISFFQGLALGVMGGIVSDDLSLPGVPLALVAFIAAALLLFLTALSVKMDFDHLVFRVGFPLMGVGFFVIATFENSLIPGSLLLYMGYAYMYLTNCCLCSYFAKGLGQSPLWIIGLATGALVVGQMTGTFLDLHLLPKQGIWLTGFMAFILILAALFLSGGNKLNFGWGLVVPGVDETLNKNFELACQLVTSERNLSKREAEVLLLLVQGRPRRLISEKLNISEETVKTHTGNIYTKLVVHSRSELLETIETRARALSV